MEYNRLKMADALTTGFLHYLCQEAIPSLTPPTTAQQIELLHHSPVINAKVRMLVASVMQVIDENLEADPR